MATPAAHSSFVVPVVLALLTPTVRAEGPPVDAREFPKLVRLLLLPEEQSLLKELKDDKDRLEFQKIFWARRDPTPATPANELKDSIRAAWTRADEIFAMPHERGAVTGCGQVLALLGPPELVEGLETQTRFDNLQAAREGSRRPETWTYRNRPGQPFSFTRAELRVAFDPECRFDEAGILLQDLRRAAQSKVARPEIAYQRGADRHLVPLASGAAGAAAAGDARALLGAPRQDFPLVAETTLVMRGAKGEAYVAGLLRASAAASGTPVSFSVAAQAVDAGGQVVASAARDVTALPEADGSLVASWGLSLKPGRYTLTVATLLTGPARGAVSTLEVEVPDFGGALLVASPLVVYPDEPPAAGAADPRDPYAAMQLGPLRIRPSFGNVFTSKDGLMVVATLHGATRDTATGQTALRARYSILKEGKPVARGAQDAFTTPDAVASVGPLPLAGYAPGAYVVRLDVTDGVTQQTLRQETTFELRATGGTP